MTSRIGRTVLTVAGVGAVILGAIFMGQGAGFIPGSFMTGDRNWLAIGIVLAAAGVFAIVYGSRRPKSGA